MKQNEHLINVRSRANGSMQQQLMWMNAQQDERNQKIHEAKRSRYENEVKPLVW